MAFFLVDGSNVLHRTMNVPALSRLQTTSGKKFGAVYGFMRHLRDRLDAQDCYRCVVVWDSGKSERRLRMYPGYKDPTLRKSSDPDYMQNFLFQRDYLMDILPYLGVHTTMQPGREADDIIWCLRQLGSLRDIGGCTILSDDRDFCQMINESTDVFMPQAGFRVTTDSFEELMKLSQDRFFLYRSILGDKSDAISGIEGVGKVSAMIIAQETPDAKDLDVIREFCQKHDNKRVREVADHIDIVKRNMDLTWLGMEEFSEPELASLDALYDTLPNRDTNKVMEYFVAMEFNSITNIFPQWSVPFLRIGARQQ